MNRLLTYVLIGWINITCASAQEAMHLLSKDDLKSIKQLENGEAPPPDNLSTLVLHDACRYFMEPTFNRSAKEALGQRASCLSYFFAIGSVLLYLDYESFETGVCLPEDMDTETLITLFYEKVLNNPNAFKDRIAIESIMALLAKEYPCRLTVPFE